MECSYANPLTLIHEVIHMGEQHYFCYKCYKVFPGSQLREVSLPGNMVVRTPMSSVYEKNGKQFVPGCPHCDNLFFFLSFNKFDMKEEQNAQTDAKW